MTLFADFFQNDHRRIHKWYHYFPVYEQHFERFRNRHVTIFEIGIGEGGSLQQWRSYFGPFAVIVGLDIYPRCRQLEDDQIHVRIGRQDDTRFLNDVLAEFGPPDIVIDDGSHLQPHINATFDVLYPQVAKNGVYLVEDLHAAYWPDHGGGVGRPTTFIEKAKRHVDLMQAVHTGGALARTPEGDKTVSVHFYDSVVVFEIGARRTLYNRMTGDPALFRGDWAPAGETAEQFDAVVKGALDGLEVAGEQFLPPPAAALAESAPALAGRAAALEADIAIIKASTSWRMTRPLRWIAALLTGRRAAD